MWQRRGGRQQQQTHVSYPVYFTELDEEEERYLETIPEVDSISSRRQSLEHSLPSLPFRVVPPLDEVSRSVDSQQAQSRTDSYDTRRIKNSTSNTQVRPDNRLPSGDVSPATPQGHMNEGSEQLSVSPVDDAPARRLLRRDCPDETLRESWKNDASYGTFRTRGLQTRWDQYSGEPTGDETGVPSSIGLGTQPLEMHFPQLKERTKQILAGLRESQTKQNSFGHEPPPVQYDSLSDRTQEQLSQGHLAGNVHTSSGQSKSVPRKHFPQRNISKEHLVAGADTAQAYDQTTSPPAAHTIRSVISEESIESIQPLRVLKKDNLYRERVPATITQMAGTPYSQTLSYQQTPEYAYVRHDSPSNEEAEPTTPVTPTPHDHSQAGIVDSLDDTPVRNHDFSQDQSRFSWTTYTETVPDSPTYLAQRDGTPPLLPTLPPNIIVKKRPVSEAVTMNSYTYQSSTTGSIVRKPMPRVSVSAGGGQNAAQRALSMSKTLPPTPTVLEATDKIENLDAQVKSLEQRKRNINRIIADLETSLIKNAITYDMWKRKEVDKRISNHKNELGDVMREMHQLSIQMNRAQRKRDRADGYENCTGLWIKRVTT